MSRRPHYLAVFRPLPEKQNEMHHYAPQQIISFCKFNDGDRRPHLEAHNRGTAARKLKSQRASPEAESYPMENRTPLPRIYLTHYAAENLARRPQHQPETTPFAETPRPPTTSIHHPATREKLRRGSAGRR